MRSHARPVLVLSLLVIAVANVPVAGAEACAPPAEPTHLPGELLAGAPDTVYVLAEQETRMNGNLVLYGTTYTTWAETNGHPGLQRGTTACEDGTIAADTRVASVFVVHWVGFIP